MDMQTFLINFNETNFPIDFDAQSENPQFRSIYEMAAAMVHNNLVTIDPEDIGLSPMDFYIVTPIANPHLTEIVEEIGRGVIDPDTAIIVVTTDPQEEHGDRHHPWYSMIVSRVNGMQDIGSLAIYLSKFVKFYEGKLPIVNTRCRFSPLRQVVTQSSYKEKRFFVSNDHCCMRVMHGDLSGRGYVACSTELPYTIHGKEIAALVDELDFHYDEDRVYMCELCPRSPMCQRNSDAQKYRLLHTFCMERLAKSKG